MWVGPQEEFGLGLGPFLVTHDRKVFGTGSAHPAEKYVEDLMVITRATWNPLRHLRYLARRVLDGRVPYRVR